MLRLIAVPNPSSRTAGSSAGTGIAGPSVTSRISGSMSVSKATRISPLAPGESSNSESSVVSGCSGTPLTSRRERGEVPALVALVVALDGHLPDGKRVAGALADLAGDVLGAVADEVRAVIGAHALQTVSPPPRGGRAPSPRTA